MKRMQVFFLMVVFLLIGGKQIQAETDLQRMIDEARPSSTIYLNSDVYKGPVRITKPLSLVGKKNTVIQSNEGRTAIEIKGRNVTLTNLTVEAKQSDVDSPALSITGADHHLKDIEIITSSIAVKMDRVEKSLVENLDILGNFTNHAFDLWYSNHIMFRQNKLQNIQDGFYLENSHNNTIKENAIKNAHYGIHLMFSDGNVIEGNQSSNSFTGAMVMGASHAMIHDNKFVDNNRNVNSQGLLLYDTKNAKIINNLIMNNRIGIFVDQSSDNELRENVIQSNFVGIQLRNANGNEMSQNSFLGNVNESQAIQSKENEFSGNYWDAAWKLDRNQDGLSDIPYQSDPFFLALTDEIPDYQLFFQAPGMGILQKLIKSPEEKILQDDQPTMESVSTVKNDRGEQRGAWIISIIFVIGSFFVFQKGRKK